MPDHYKSTSFLSKSIIDRQSLLVVGLDTDPVKLPATVKGDVLLFNREIIEATKDKCIAYKLNFAFYESMGLEGWKILEETIRLIPSSHFIIADAKRGDIGNTSEMYAKAIFDHLGCDAVTVSPYMGSDSVKPFFRKNKWVIILALTSNHGSGDFQMQKLADGKLLYQHVMEQTSTWGDAGNTMYVVGATHPDELQRIRQQFPDHFFLIPGIGAQGGSAEDVCRAAINTKGGLLINASRSILYAGTGPDFANKAAAEATRINTLTQPFLSSVTAD